MFTLIDGAGVLVATLLYVPLLVLPGYAIGAAFDGLGFRAASGTHKIGLAALFGLTILPAPLAMACALLGIQAVLALLCVGLICGGAALFMDGLPRLSKRVVLAAAGWLAIVAFFWIDIEIGDRLHQSLLILDMAKHAAITRGIVDVGAAPPADPFFARDGAAVFYYFFFIVPAALETLMRGAIDSRAAVGGMVVWTGFALLTLALELYRRSGLRGPVGIGPLLVVLAATGGMQLLLALLLKLSQSGWANTQITPWALALLWVPHHVAAFVASWVALLLLVETELRRGAAGRGYGMLMSACALASAAGLSVWITIGTVTVFGLWAVWLAWERRFALLLRMMIAGIGSIMLALPFLLQIVADHQGTGGSPIAFAVRKFVFVDDVARTLGVPPLATSLLNALTLPINYLYEMGLILIGGAIYWTRPRLQRPVRSDVGLLLALSAVAAFIVGSFFKSAISNNDLGWRVMMFAQMPLLLWTAHVLQPFARGQRAGAGVQVLKSVPRGLRVFALLGLAVVAYDLIMLRIGFAVPLQMTSHEERRPDVALDLRRAYTWMNANVPAGAITQHNPNRLRAYAFALYGRHLVGVSDTHNPYLLGADSRAVDARLTDITPIFETTMPVAAVVEAARRHGISRLVVAATDSVWAGQPEWLTGAAVVYRSPTVRIVQVDRLVISGRAP